VVVVRIWIWRPQSLSVDREKVGAFAFAVAVVVAGQAAFAVEGSVGPGQSENALGVESRRFVMKTTPRAMAKYSSPVSRISMDSRLDELGYGSLRVSHLTRQEIEHLLNGGALATEDDGEFVHVLLFKEAP
jgi:hypothetical protein